jgi:hypothetical protein
VTEHDRPTGRGETDDGPIQERLVSTQCRACGGPIDYAGTGRRPRYCSPACRQHGWALHRAAVQLERDDPRPTVVREVVARERVRTVRVAGKAPTLPEDWARQVDTLTAQLADPEHVAAKVTWQHQRLAYALAHALAALDRAHPGGLNWDQLPVRPHRPTAPG